MDTANMTATELRALANEREATRLRLMKDYTDVDDTHETFSSSGHIEPWERVLEFEGEKYPIDMRRIKSRRFLHILAAVQDAHEQGDDQPISPTLALFDYVFGGKVDDRIVEVVTAKYGYDNAEEIIRIESALLEMLDTKN